MSLDPFKWPLGKGVEVIACDAAGIVALSKPAGILSHPNKKGDEPRCVIQAGYEDSEEKYECEKGPLYLLHRLDSATSGVLLLASDLSLARQIKDLFASSRVKKTYRALVFGKFRGAGNLWSDKLVEKRTTRGLRVSTSPSGRLCETFVRCLRTMQGPVPLSLLEMQPKTGFTHQLRIQCALRNLPIVGDQTYGDFLLNKLASQHLGDKRLFLHSMKIEFAYEYQTSKKTFKCYCAPPKFMD